MVVRSTGEGHVRRDEACPNLSTPQRWLQAPHSGMSHSDHRPRTSTTSTHVDEHTVDEGMREMEETAMRESTVMLVKMTWGTITGNEPLMIPASQN